MKVFEARGFALTALVSIALASVGCAPTPAGMNGDGGSNGGGGGGGEGGCMTSEHFDISGGYEERYNCASEGVCTEKDVTFYLHITPDPDDTDLTDGKDYTFCETGGLGPLCKEIPDSLGTFLFSGSGTICGSTFRWNAESPGAFTEVGVWEFREGGDAFTKTSMYTYIDGGGGICTGTGQRGGGAGDPPLLPCDDPMTNGL